MAKHTEGPWRIKRTNATNWDILCETNIPNVPGTVAKVGYLPNANLIAAAPDLLAALKKTCSNAVELGYCNKNQCKGCDNYKAIVKAEH